LDSPPNHWCDVTPDKENVLILALIIFKLDHERHPYRYSYW
jgi:hypothetical protein